MNRSLVDLTILLVEPSTPQAKIIGRKLEEAGVLSYRLAATGEEALREIRHTLPDLVISAMYLPDMTGSELVQAIRADADIYDTAFMLISSETSFDALDPIRQAGATAILPKPFETAHLRKALAATLDLLDPNTLYLENYDPAELRVLVVDDSLTARNHMVKLLEGMGVERITKAINGQDAISKIENDFFDLIMTDYNMPKMDGKALTQYVRQNSQQASIPIIMVTSEESESKLAEVHQSGISAVCGKPFDPSTLKQLIEALLTDA